MLAVVRVDPVTVSAAIVACAAVATLAAGFARRRLDTDRDETRQRDRTYGWRDSRTGRWHQGTNDLVLGWTDDDGVHHPGDHERLERHLSDRSLHGGPRE